MLSITWTDNWRVRPTSNGRSPDAALRRTRSCVSLHLLHFKSAAECTHTHFLFSFFFFCAPCSRRSILMPASLLSRCSSPSLLEDVKGRRYVTTSPVITTNSGDERRQLIRRDVEPRGGRLEENRTTSVFTVC